MIIDRYMIQHREDLVLQNVMSPMLGDTEPYDKKRFWRLIDRWKAYLVNEYGLRKGQVVGWGVAKNNVECHAIWFALAELGAQIFPAHLAWHPDIETPTMCTITKPAFGFWDNVTLQMVEGSQASFFGKYVECEMINIDTAAVEYYTEPMDYNPPDVLPDDPFFISYSDGEFEDGFDLQYYTHREVWGLAHRQYKLMNMHDTLAVHTFNFMHCMSFITYSLPAYFGCKNHYVVNWWDRISMWKPAMLNMLETIYSLPQKKVVFVKNNETLEHTLSVLNEESKPNIEFVLPYGEANEDLHRISREHNVNITVFYGETRVKAPTLLTKPIRPNSAYLKDHIGFLADNYYECVYSPQKKALLVRGHHDTKYRQLSWLVDKNDETQEYKFVGYVEKHPFQDRVEAIFGHDEFFLLRKYGENYLAVFEEPTVEQYALLDPLGLTHIAVIDRMAYCLENKRYRDWFALKNQFWYGFDSYEEGRVRYYNGEE